MIVRGTVAQGFECVMEVFADNFASRGELGASFSVVRHGKTVVDLWGGLADPAGREWEPDTLQVIFSGTKALVALCLLILVDRGKVDMADRVCRYWPEFAASGKQDIQIIDVLSHQARLPGLSEPVRENDILNGQAMAEALAMQEADRDPRSRRTYHALTFGWLCGELIRRVDGRSVGRFFEEEVRIPLGLDLWIGLPALLEPRVSTVVYAANWGHRQKIGDIGAGDDLEWRVWGNPPLFPADHIPWNRSKWHEAEIPGAGGIGTARSVALLFGCLAQGGRIAGIQIISEETLRCARREASRRQDPLLDEPHVFGAGFQLQTERHQFGPPADAFGHGGAGGSVHCAWPSHGVGMSYVMNLMRDDEAVDARASELLRAVHRAIQPV